MPTFKLIRSDEKWRILILKNLIANIKYDDDIWFVYELQHHIIYASLLSIKFEELDYFNFDNM